MAKRGGVQQLQADINNDEDFERFLEHSGLLDVYSEWCGPCLGMVGTLKKIKLELGGDNLQLAICKSDYIQLLTRFRYRSEPTWLFVKNGRAINLMFGTNVPKLTHLIASELDLLNAKEDNRRTYDIDEPQPEEVAQMEKKEAAEREAKRIELEEVEKNRREYLTHVTDEIMSALPDMGVTMFGPQVNRDMFKKLIEPAEEEKIQCKDRRVDTITKDKFDIVHFACDNRIEDEILEQIINKDLLFCFWKISDTDERPVQDVLTAYAHALTSEKVQKNEFGVPDPSLPPSPPLLKPLEVHIQIKEIESVKEDENLQPEEIADDPYAEVLMELDMAETNVEEPIEEAEAATVFEDVETIPDIGFDLLTIGEENLTLAVPEEIVEEVIPTKTIIIPPIWVPNNHRTHAALIYVFFRTQTKGFLPPDPVPEPPHIIMAFDAYKRKDIFEVAEKHKQNVLLSGFFTSDDPQAAKLIANSMEKYDELKPDKNDRIILKVSKSTSHTMLALGILGPSYVSPNTVIGKQEAVKFFPDDYVTPEMEEAEKAKEEKESETTKKKSKKGEIDAGPSAEEGS